MIDFPDLGKVPSTRPHVNDEGWQDYAFRMAATYDLSLKPICDFIGVNYNVAKGTVPFASKVAAGRALFKLNAHQEFTKFMFLDTDIVEDPAERKHLQLMKLDALKHWTKLDQRREEMEIVRQTVERPLKDVPTEELKAKLREML